MPDIRCVSATFLIATPLFLGGARQEAEGFRIASLKGSLRFWWRAVEYPKHFVKEKSRQDALGRLREAEVKLFGSTAAQARVLMRLEPRRTPLPRLEAGKVLTGADDGHAVGPGARYLGYGLMEAFDNRNTGKKAGELTRSCLLPGHYVRVSFRFKAGAAVESFLDALKLFGLVGGLGSRARRGWGSLALVRLEGDGVSWQPPTSEEAYRIALLNLLPDLSLAEAEPSFTAFGPQARIDLLGTGPDALHTLDRLGRAMQRYRAWGHRKGDDDVPMVNGEPSEKNFQRDHDWSKKPFGPEHGNFVPERAVFGLPQNYGKGFSVAPAVARMDRRASPLLLHVHPLDAQTYLGVALVLPAQFLPGGRDEVTITHNNRTGTRRASIKWKVLDDFLDGPTEPARRKALGSYFPQRVRVLPDRR